MSIAGKLLPEFDREMASTRKVLERVPDADKQWKPHPKSFAIAHLAQLVSGMPGWITNALTETSLNLAEYPGYSFESTETLLAEFDRNVRSAREALQNARDEDFDADWSLRKGDQVFMTMPREDIVRMHISHLIHHRGQLTVYLRLLDVPVPAVYGPTADESW